ncbi:MAG TPA: anthranilate phosphoribosyltransferase [Planctomycetota bacterium]|nr:anthranilate phosphoribosyltransferase [Planctomycetota bacterium]
MTASGEFRLADALPRLAARQSLSRKEAQGAMSTLLAGEATPAQAGAFLLGLRSKGETEEEIAGLVEGMREAGVKIRPRREPLLDLCGTGGDGSGTFNISTGASLVAAGAGAAVAKHGNRSASSRCGSADVLEALGVPIDLPPERAERAVDEVGFAFLFAPLYHPAMKHVAAIRKELKIRTVFNLLGPLSSPATVPYQLVGVYEGAVRGTVARVLSLLGSRRAWVVHGAGGLDELSLAGPADVTASGTETGGSTRSEFRVGPEDCGLPSCPVESILGGDAAQNAAILERVLAGEEGPHRDVIVLNAAAALVVAGIAPELREAAERARAAIDSGAARRVLSELRRFR